MRHLWSFLAGIVAAPLAWLLLATGQHRSQVTVGDWDAAGAFNTAQLIGPVVFLVVAGVLLGLLGTLRWSPLGPLAAGLLFVLPTIFLFVNPFRTLDSISGEDGWTLLGQDFAPRLPVENGTLLVLGVLLLMAAFSSHRWRQWPTALEPIAPATDAQVVSGMAELTSTANDVAMTDEQNLAEARVYEQADGKAAEAETAEAETAEAETAEAEASGAEAANEEAAGAEAAVEAETPEDTAEGNTRQ
jgi:hypothetical protein